MSSKALSPILLPLLLLVALYACKLSSNNPKPLVLQQIQVPPYPGIDTGISSFIPPGQTFTTVITNNSTHAVKLYPYLNRHGMEQIAWSDSFLLAYLQSQVAGLSDIEAIRLKLVQVVGTTIEKTDLFEHGQVIFQASDYYLCKTQNSLMGALNGTYHKQCSSYIKNGIAILIRTGYFNYDNIKIAELAGHTTGAFLYKGEWAFFDFDPLEPFFMLRNTANKNGFASPLDLHNNPGLITADQRYYYVNDAGIKLDLCPFQKLTKYRAHFDSVSMVKVPYAIDPLIIPGEITLPPKASMACVYTVPYILAPLAYQRFIESFDSGMSKISATLSDILGISPDSATDVLINGKISIYNSTKNWQPGFLGVTPAIKIILPATPDTIKTAGSGDGDISFPGYILQSTISIYPDIFQAGQNPRLWNQRPRGQAPLIGDNEVHYLAEPNEYILPHPEKADTITVSYNPRVLNFGTGFKLGYLSADDLISVHVFKNDSLVSQQATYTADGKTTKHLSQTGNHK